MGFFLNGIRVALFFSCAAACVFTIFFHYGPPLSDSYIYNASWLPAFQNQFFSGAFYPRWLHTLNQGAGSPVFYFYGPFPFWISAVFSQLLCPDCSPQKSLMIGPMVLFALSGISFYYWARFFSSARPAFLASVLYVFLPYHFEIDLWHRGALGEVACYVWMPIVLLGLAKAASSKPYLILSAVGYAGLIYSHLPGALLFSPVMLLFAISQHGPQTGIRVLFFPVVLGLGLASLYLLPALTTQDYINASAWWAQNFTYYDPRSWLWFNGLEKPPAAYAILPSLLIPTLMCIIIARRLSSLGQAPNPISIFIALALIYAWFLMTYPSIFLWDNISILQKVQFPWRVGIVIDLCVATLFAVWLEHILTDRRLFKATLAATALLMIGHYALAVPEMRSKLLAFSQSDKTNAISISLGHGFDAVEYRPSWSLPSKKNLEAKTSLNFAENRPLSWSRYSGENPLFDELVYVLSQTPEVLIVSGQGEFENIRNDHGALSLTLKASTPIHLQLRRFYYPDWQLSDEASTKFIPIAPSRFLGLVEAKLPTGTHQLVLKKQPLMTERIGALLSLASLMVCLCVLGLSLFRRVRPLQTTD